MNAINRRSAFRRFAPYPAASVLLLVPCFWQSRLQAGDLSSHIYNAWLAELIEKGHAQGLTIVRQLTNVMFDLMLSSLFRMFGADAAQRIAVSIAVLTFVWGAFAFINALAGRRCWSLIPCIAMLAYGWVFHMGFFNFYISMGLCFWAMSMMWRLDLRGFATGVAVLALAYFAHALPVYWSCGLMAYVAVARRLSIGQRAALTAGCLCAMAIVRSVALRMAPANWSARQFATSVGIDQVWVYDTKYFGIGAALMFIWGLLFLCRLKGGGFRDMASGVAFQMCILTAAAVFILPGAILLPGFAAMLSFIPQRMSLGVAVCVCGLIGAVPPRRFERCALVAVAVVFFAFLYRDEKALNALEDRVQEVVATLPEGERVVSAIADRQLRADGVTHMIDRACIGRCFSYANYEPSTKQFRIRVLGPNPIVAAHPRESARLQTGRHVVQEGDLPLYAIDIDSTGKIVLKAVRPGTTSGTTYWNVLENQPSS
jgi:hypothetical protein